MERQGEDTSTISYFPNLNALRFIAAFIVLVGHTEQLKGHQGYKLYFHEFPFLFQGGQLAVTFFFVLSGYLITYLILKDLKNKRFRISDFYKKRILRIWPLYFLIVAIGLFVVPEISFFTVGGSHVSNISTFNLDEVRLIRVFYLTVLPNVALGFGVIPYLSHTWSIGVEEQFYLLWPVLMFAFRKRVPVLLFTVIAVMILLRHVLPSLDLNTFIGSYLGSITRINAMAIGGLGAYSFFKNNALIGYLSSRPVEILALSTTFICYVARFDFGTYEHNIYAVLFLLIILNASTNPRSLLRLERIRLLNYFGTVSYGIYMYHPITGMLSLLLFNWIHPSYMASLSSNVVFYGLVFAITLLTATLSYELVEKRIMKFGRERWLKER